ncbi:LysR family transcriptional regulator [Streptacidiphilus neutrinimicus]|uniref:LysR family transcriptional regulator n=1 Tax=Streptacidiphilus neutrinimicus TaxID=105420 RepID=UPI0005A7A33D|nr:LysR family transcriptional regulator [Streptacidiphilus neutrinimicus]
MELRQLRAFEAVTAHRTVANAANALGLAPSSVAERIRELEQSLDVPLFARTPRGMTLTPAGKRLLPWARHLLDAAEEARQETVTERPELRLGVLEAVSAAGTRDASAGLAERRPDVRVAPHTLPERDGLLTAVAAGALHAAVILDASGPLGGLGFALPPAPLDHLDLEDVPLTLVAAPGHPLQGRAELSAEDLRGQRLLVGAPACSFFLAGQRLLGDAVERVPTGGIAVTRACAERGLGVALLPHSAVRQELATGTLVRLHASFMEQPLRLRVVWRADREALPGLWEMLHALAP